MEQEPSHVHMERELNKGQGGIPWSTAETPLPATEQPGEEVAPYFRKRMEEKARAEVTLEDVVIAMRPHYWRDYARLSLQKWGQDAQLDMVIEECAELTKAIVKLKRCYVTAVQNRRMSMDVVEEAVDVSIMLDFIREYFGITPSEWGEARRKKVRRLRKRLAKEVQHDAIG